MAKPDKSNGFLPAGERFNDADVTASFLVKVQFRQNSTWQGTVEWIETGKTKNFRSCLELLKLMDTAVSGETNSD